MAISFYCQVVLPDNCNTCNTSSNSCSDKSRTFFRPRSEIENVIHYLGFNDYKNYLKYYDPFGNCEDAPRIHFNAGIFYEKSTRAGTLGKYFTPGNKCSVAIREDGSGDVGSLWLKVIAPLGESYSSDLVLHPHRTVFGAYFNYHQDFCFINGLWLDLKWAVYRANHDLHPCEKVNDGLGTIGNIKTALDYLSSTSEIKCGVLPRCSKSKTGVDDIELKLGYGLFGCERYHLDLYGSVLIPVSSKPTAKYLFEPLVGRDHWGLGAGYNTGFRLYCQENAVLVWLSDFQYSYLFAGNERRSMDLVNGEWSRFLRLVTQDTPAISFPAVDITTYKLKVTPRSSVNWWSALHYQRCNLHVEAGYNFWWRQKEKVCLSDTCAKPGCCGSTNTANIADGNIGIFDLANSCNPVSASNATISQGATGTNAATGDAAFTALTLSNLDTNSAAHPSVTTNKVYLMLGYDFWTCAALALGGSYEFADKNGISQWGLWVDLNINF